MPYLKLATAGASALLAAGLMAVASPAAAQATVEEITVTGTYGPRGEPQSLSAPVSFADLDLTTKPGQDELMRRVRATAEELCAKLGEPGGSVAGSVVPSCRDEAVQKAQSEMRTAIAQATPRGPGWVAPAPSYAAAPPPPAPAAATYAEPAAATTRLVTNGPVPDTPENRDRFGGPMSNAGKRTAPAGN